AGGVGDDDGGTLVLVGAHDRLVEMIHVGGGGLRDEDVGVGHDDLGQFFAALGLAGDLLAVDGHLGVLAHEGGGGGLAAGVGIDLGVEDDDLDVHAAHEHAG